MIFWTVISFYFVQLLQVETSFQCKSAGPTCEDCRTPAVCVDLGEGAWEKIGTTICEGNFHTSCFNGSCTKGPNPSCDGTINLPFPCTSVGMFPDPFFCDRYHFCMPPEPYHMTTAICEPGYIYNSRTTFCEEPSPEQWVNKCDRSSGTFPVPLCKTPGQSGPLDNGSLYYICKDYYERLYPFLYKCPIGLEFSNYKCG